MTDGIKKLSDYEHVRLRTEMYLGSRSPHTQEIISYNEGVPVLKEYTWTPAAFTAFREVLDNSLDEIIGHGFGSRIDVEYDEANKIFSVKDNGRGIPITWDDKEEMHKATLVLTHTRAGRNFGERQEVAGTNGIGASAVNFCSEFFEVTINRDNTKFEQKFVEGEHELKIDPPKMREVKSDASGTAIRFKLSSKVFSSILLPLEFIRDRLYEVAVFNPQLTVYFNKEKIKVGATIERSLFNKEKVIKFDINEDGFRSTFFVKPNFQLNSSEYMFSFVNNVPAFNGGTHMDTFRRQFISGVLDALTREGKKRKLTPNRSDVNEGLLILNHTKMRAPNFDSQSKTRLINEEPAKIITAAIDAKEIAKMLRKHEDWVEQIFERCAFRTNKQDQKDLEKESKKLSRRKIPKLRDATSSNRQDCILLLAEGDSAISGSAAVRDPKIHAGLPLRGKVLNVNGESPKTVIDNKELADIMSAIGLAIGKKAVRDDLRYGRIYLAHDADPDGANIGALLVNFFHTFWPELFTDEKNPFISVFMTPFIIAQKGKERRYWYSDNYAEFKPEDYKGWSITRAKGLGTLEEPDWEHSLKSPKLFHIVDDGKMKEALDLIFNGSKADDRKLWMGI
jgi:DNA gyrase/topoisomerase IV subunit B